MAKVQLETITETGKSETRGEEAELKSAFKFCGLNGDGRLGYEAFFALLKNGNEEFPEAEAIELFRSADKDLSGEIDFSEFVDFIYDNKDFSTFLKEQRDGAAEQEARARVMKKCVNLRTNVSKAVAKVGKEWRHIKWKHRLAAIERFESGKLPLLDVESDPESEPDREVMPPEPEGKPAEEPPADEPVRKPPSRKPNILDGKTQFEMVDYSIHRYDLAFAGKDRKVQAELTAFREHLKFAEGPPSQLEISRFIAKGTQGWVFEGSWNETRPTGFTLGDSSPSVAVKVIRMTQSLGGVKEWYISKLLQKAEVEKIVFTNPTVYVITRSKAHPVIKAQIQDAGPVEHYVCLTQEFMSGGSLEQLAADESCTPKKMFAALEDVASTLALMHKSNIHHRDVKPENILLVMKDDAIVVAKLCDLGSAEIGNGAEGRADDVRRFGVTLFSVAAAESWTKSRLIHEKHANLVTRLKDAVKSSSEKIMRKLPDVLEEILAGDIDMIRVTEIMKELRNSC